MRETIGDYLDLSDDIRLCGSAGTAAQALAELEALAPSIVILDLSLPDLNGLELLKRIREQWQLECVILSGHREESYVRRAYELGARGYVYKGRPQELLVAIRDIRDGKTYFPDPSFSGRSSDGSSRG